MEQSYCPQCQSELNPYDRRDRKCRDGNGDQKVLVIRRLRCCNQDCRRIHAELPEYLVPYKRYAVEVIAAVLTGTAVIAPNEEATRRRWRTWYKQIRDHLLCVATSVNRILQETARVLLASPSIRAPYSIPLLTDFSLAELVRLAVNTGNWITTRSAIVTGPLSLYNQAQTQKK